MRYNDEEGSRGAGANAQDRTPSRCGYGGRALTNRATGGRYTTGRYGLVGYTTTDGTGG